MVSFFKDTDLICDGSDLTTQLPPKVKLSTREFWGKGEKECMTLGHHIERVLHKIA